MNFAEQLAQINWVRRGSFDFEPSERDTLVLVCQLLNEADREINRRLHIAKTTFDTTLNTSASFNFYPRPPDVLDNLILDDGIALIFSDATPIAPPTRIDEAKARDTFGASFTNPQRLSNAIYWWFATYDYRIGLGWPPQKAGTLRYTYVKDPVPLDAETVLYRSADNPPITAAFTRGLAVVTFSVPISPALIHTHDQIGKGLIPNAWYYVDELTTDGSGNVTQCTISKQFAGVTNAAADFVVSAVSDIEKEAGNAQVGWLAVWYALGKLMVKSDPQLAAKYEGMFEAKLLSARPSQAGTQIQRGPSVNQLAGFGRRV